MPRLLLVRFRSYLHHRFDDGRTAKIERLFCPHRPCPRRHRLTAGSVTPLMDMGRLRNVRAWKSVEARQGGLQSGAGWEEGPKSTTAMAWRRCKTKTSSNFPARHHAAPSCGLAHGAGACSDAPFDPSPPALGPCRARRVRTASRPLSAKATRGRKDGSLSLVAPRQSWVGGLSGGSAAKLMGALAVGGGGTCRDTFRKSDKEKDGREFLVLTIN